MERNEQKINDTWDLSSLSASDEAFLKDLKKLEKRVKEIKALKGTIGKDSDSFHNALCLLRDILRELERLSSYAFLKYSVDSTNATVMKNAGLYEEVENKISEALSFFDPELMAIEDEKINAYLKEKRNREFVRYVKKSRRFKEHILSEKEERLLSLYSPVGSSFQDTFQDMNNIDLDFGEINGEKLTHSNYTKFIRDENEDIRREAYTKLYAAYERNRHTLARIYSGSVKNDIFRARARGYKSSLDKALFPDRIPQAVYLNLIEEVHKAFPLLHRYYQMKARSQGKEKIMHYDVYLSMEKDVKVNYSYDEAVSIISDTVKVLGEDYRTTLVDGLTKERWVDRYNNKGKRSGAFSAGGYTGKPYIMMNYEDAVLDSVYTLIHEGGHSMHTYYSVRNNPFMSYNYTIFEAEVASTFNESLLTDYLIKNSDDKVRKYIVSKHLDDIVATLFRQTMFAEYELIVHEDAQKGVPLTIDYLRSTYRKLLDEYFGEAVGMLDVSDLEALRIPHFYTAFYTYKYATGISAALALSEKVLGGGEKERNDYLAFLKSGGSEYPINALKKAGVDMSRPEPVRSATEHFEGMLDLFESLNQN